MRQVQANHGLALRVHSMRQVQAASHKLRVAPTSLPLLHLMTSPNWREQFDLPPIFWLIALIAFINAVSFTIIIPLLYLSSSRRPSRHATG